MVLIEEPLFITEFPTHRQKCLLHRLSLEAYAAELSAAGYRVSNLDVCSYPTTAAMLAAVAVQGYTNWHVVDTTDNWLERRLEEGATTHGATLVRYESPLFLLTKTEAVARYQTSKRFMARFYTKLRKDLGILLEADGTPVGGAWSFDTDNRKRLPRGLPLPEDISFYSNERTLAAAAWLAELPGEQYGEPTVWVPYTRAAAQQELVTFLEARLVNFGPYEDALSTEHTRLFHSALSPLINIGLLTPREVVEAALTFAREHDVPIASLEGFVRQIVGWREFIRASYVCDGVRMRTSNFFAHTAPLPAGMWDATTGLAPLDGAVARALRYGYAHHIERLMVIGNYLLLTETHPDNVYRWFMAMYVDAYDWVMVPNVYGMSQFADGGLFATKPYIAGGNYLAKLSHLPKGEWYEVYTALFWRFIERHEKIFLANHRLAMMPRLLAKRPPAERTQLHERAEAHLEAARKN